MGMAAALVFFAGGAWAQLDTDVPLGHVKIQSSSGNRLGCEYCGHQQSQ